VADNYRSVHWTPMNVDLLSTFYDVAPLSMQCNHSDGTRFKGYEWNGVKKPTIIEAMPEKVRPCLQ